MRLWPRDLLGQTLMALAIALFIAQAISAGLLYRAASERRDIALMNAAAFQLVVRPGDRPDRQDRPKRILHRNPPDEPRPMRRLPRSLRLTVSDRSPVQAGDTRKPDLASALTEILAREGVVPAELVVVERPLATDALLQSALQRRPLLGERARRSMGDLLVVGLRQQGANRWDVVRIAIPPMDARVIWGLLLQTAILFAVLMSLLFLALRRITRPLAALTRRTTQIAVPGSDSAPLDPSGPRDIRALISAHNAMEARIGAMLDEKDVMLGAIGHDLKTPLAALRVRIESVDDERQRATMAATIEDITRTLDEILELARIGRATKPPERADLFALAASVVEEFEDLGEEVELADSEKVSASVHITWLKRALRNLVGNALRYGGSAQVSLHSVNNEAVLRVEDSGPGIPEDRLAAMTEPFVRGEASRSRSTGGTGLGLTLARAIAEQHGGTLVLANRPEGGLAAEIRLPASPPRFA
ncbi:MAG: ATP-binding protein [Sphingomonadaceae bacterium]